MGLALGVHPGGKKSFAVSALYWEGQWPALAFRIRSFSGVDEVLQDLIGVCGEWGQLQAIAIDAPLTWSGAPSGWRHADRTLAAQLPKAAPSQWIRSPNALPGASAVQGPALALSLQREAQAGQIPKHHLLETHAKASLAHTFAGLNQALCGYRNRDLDAQTRRAHLHTLVHTLGSSGLLRWEEQPPSNADEFDALLAALVALGVAEPNAGLAIQTLAGGEIQPVGLRPIAILQALP